MKDAADWVAKAQSETSIELSDQQRIYLHNFFLQVQADAFQHAAGLVDEALKDVDVKGPGIFLRAHARAIWPGVSIPSPSNDAAKSDMVPQEKYVPESQESST